LTVRGRVLDPEGKPVGGARVQLSPTYQRGPGPARTAVSGADGRFQFLVPRSDSDRGPFVRLQVVGTADGFGLGWVNLTPPKADGDVTLQMVKDVPITGRIIDPEGRPIAGATLRLLGLAATPEGDLSPWLEAVGKKKVKWLIDSDYFKDSLPGGVPGLPITVTTDRAGRFHLAGIGRERILLASVGAPKYQFDMIGIISRLTAAFQVTDESKFTANVYGAKFDHVLAPSRVLTGTVRDKDTGQPIAGVLVLPESARDYGSPDATTDKDGKYRIDSLPSHHASGVMVFGPRNEPYLRANRALPPGGPRDEPVVLDFTLMKGIWVTVKVTNKATGKPVPDAHIEYYPFRDNPNTAGLTNHFFEWLAHLDPHRTGADGAARVAALPGPGVIGAAVDDSTAFVHAEPPRAANVVSGIQYGHMPNFIQGGVRINPGKEAKSTTYEIGLDPGGTLTCAIVGPDGKPLTGCRLFNGVPNVFASWAPEPLAGSDFTLRHLPAGKPYTLIVLHPEKKLVRLLELKGGEKGPLTVKLEPAGTVTGRLLNPDGKPMPRTGLTIDFELPIGGGLLPHYPEVKTDAEGRFRIDGLAPGLPYFVLLGKPPLFVGEVTRLKIRTGETRDLGEVKYMPLPQEPGGQP
jgi:hypothetical protein